MAIRRIQIAFLSIAIVFLAAACNIQLRVTIDVQEDGSGKVTAAVGLDPIAQDQEVFEDLESILRTSDLSENLLNLKDCVSSGLSPCQAITHPYHSHSPRAILSHFRVRSRKLLKDYMAIRYIPIVLGYIANCTWLYRPIFMAI